MQVRLKHTLGFMSFYFCSTYSNRGLWNWRELRAIGNTELRIRQGPARKTLSVLSDITATSGTKRADWEPCVDPNDSGTRNINCSLVLIVKSRYMILNTRTATLDILEG